MALLRTEWFLNTAITAMTLNSRSQGSLVAWLSNSRLKKTNRVTAKKKLYRVTKTEKAVLLCWRVQYAARSLKVQRRFRATCLQVMMTSAFSSVTNAYESFPRYTAWQSTPTWTTAANLFSAKSVVNLFCRDGRWKSTWDLITTQNSSTSVHSASWLSLRRTNCGCTAPFRTKCPARNLTKATSNRSKCLAARTVVWSCRRKVMTSPGRTCVTSAGGTSRRLGRWRITRKSTAVSLRCRCTHVRFAARRSSTRVRSCSIWWAILEQSRILATSAASRTVRKGRWLSTWGHTPENAHTRASPVARLSSSRRCWCSTSESTPERNLTSAPCAERRSSTRRASWSICESTPGRSHTSATCATTATPSRTISKDTCWHTLERSHSPAASVKRHTRTALTCVSTVSGFIRSTSANGQRRWWRPKLLWQSFRLWDWSVESWIFETLSPLLGFSRHLESLAMWQLMIWFNLYPGQLLFHRNEVVFVDESICQLLFWYFIKFHL